MKEPSVSIYIDGNAISVFKQFSLNQSIYSHHEFELVVGHEVIEELGSQVLDKSKSWVGKVFQAEFGENEFIGVITSVDMSHFHGMHGDLIVRGYSPTILLEAGPHKRSWLKRPLKDIVNDTVMDAGLSVSPNPAHTASVDYMVQYRESHFNFLKRLAATYHEWFFYDGRDIQFGKPSSLPTVPLIYGTDLDNVQLSMRMAPVNFQAFSHHSGNDEIFSGTSPGSVSGLDDMGSEAMAAGSQAYLIQAKSATTPRIKDKNRLQEVLKKQQAAAAAGLSRITGKGTKQELSPGVIVDLKAAIRESGAWASKPYGEYLIIGVQHFMTGNHEYMNSFEAIPAGLEVLPPPDFLMPTAEPQTAKVVSNTDPQNQGRVQVCFHWQEGGEQSPFLRVMSPDAGKSDAVSQNRGMMFIPEVGDHVMVGFRYNDPMRPFVMGSVYTGVTGGGGGSANNTKSLSSKSGNTISLDDGQGKGSITIEDGDGNKINLDGEGNISLTANSSITLKTGKSEIKLDKEGKITINGTAIETTGSESTKTVTGGNSFSTSDSTATVEGKTVTVSGSKEVTVNGTSKTTVSSAGKVALMGATVTLN